MKDAGRRWPAQSQACEVRFITNNFSAEYGRSAGGVVVAAGKTGTNTVHGSVYDYMKNDKLNANSWANNRNNARRLENTRTLTLNPGMRFEYQTPFKERYNHLAYFDPSGTRTGYGAETRSGPHQQFPPLSQRPEL